MKFTVVSLSGREVLKAPLDLPDTATVADLQEAFHKRAKKFYPSRQRLTLPVAPGSKDKPVVLNSKKSLKEYTDGNTNSLTVVFKDLGAQVSYRTLFFFGYLADGTDIGPSKYSQSMTVSSLKKKIISQWPKDQNLRQKQNVHLRWLVPWTEAKSCTNRSRENGTWAWSSWGTWCCCGRHSTGGCCCFPCSSADTKPRD